MIVIDRKDVVGDGEEREWKKSRIPPAISEGDLLQCNSKRRPQVLVPIGVRKEGMEADADLDGVDEGRNVGLAAWEMNTCSKQLAMYLDRHQCYFFHA